MQISVKSKQKCSKNRRLYLINKGFESIFNAELMEKYVLDQPASGVI